MPSTSDINKWRHGPSPSPADATKTIAHLCDTCDRNHVHSIRHLFQARDDLTEFHGGDSSRMAAVAFNTQHSLRHTEETIEHAEKLGKHIHGQGALLTHVPKPLLNTFLRLGEKLADNQEECLKLMNQSFPLMANAHADESVYRRLYDTLKKAYRLMEDADGILDSMTAAVLAHEETKTEYAKLAASARMPATQLPQSTKEWLNETLTLLKPRRPS